MIHTEENKVIYKLSHEEFFQFTEKLASVEDFKFEYANGKVFPLQGGESLPSWYIDYVLSQDFPSYQIKTNFNMAATTKHDTIVSNLHILLGSAVKGKDIIIYSQSTNIYIEIKETIRVPDIVATKRSGQKRNKMHELLNPLALFEVFSKSTKKIDETEKLEEYKSIESVVEYVMIDQQKPYVSLHRRVQESKWEQETFTALNSAVHLTSLATTISLSDIYENIDWDEKE
jgi:Uma2 family endonuclease